MLHNNNIAFARFAQHKSILGTIDKEILLIIGLNKNAIGIFGTKIFTIFNSFRFGDSPTSWYSMFQHQNGVKYLTTTMLKVIIMKRNGIQRPIMPRSKRSIHYY